MRGSKYNPHDNTTRDMRGALKRLARMLRPERVRISGVVLLMLIATAAQVYAPKALGDATNVIVEGLGSTGTDFNRLGKILLFVVGLYAVSAVMNFLGGILIRQTVQNLGYKLRQAAQEKIDRLSLAWIDRQQRGDLLSRVTNDIDNITQTLLQTLNNAITSIYMLVGVLGLMFWISVPLSVLALLPLPLGVLATIFILRKSKPEFRKQWAMTGEVSSIIEESFTGLDVVTAYNLQEEFEDVFDEANQGLYRAGFRGQFFSQLSQPVMGFISNLSFVVVAVAGGLFVINGRLTIGGIQAFIQYSRQLNQPVGTLASMLNLLQSGAASGERIFDFLDSDEMSPDASGTYSEALPSAEQHGAIEFDHVRFGYTDMPVIKNLSLRVAPGEQVAIVGPTGAGKTTLVNLLMRFYEIDSGDIRIDGVSTREFSKDSLRSRMGMVLQDTWLFEGTIEENIAFGKDGATREDVVRAAKATGVDRIIRQLPDGYETIIDDEGANISAGEKQLLTIARAYLADPQVLILDEATSSVDTRTEMLVQRAMNELRTGRTSFVIAHRLSTIRDADTIMVMVDGDVVEQGTHEELLNHHGAYYDLYNSQFAGEEA